MMAAIGAADTFKKEGREGSIQILEKMPRPGRKIMITGKGRCNLTNLKDWNEFSGHVHPKANMLKPAFFNMSAEKTVGLFNTAGLETVTEHGDRVFPASYISSDVVDTLTAAIERSGARLVTGCEVSSIESTGETYSIKCRNGKTFTAGKVIIATGGLSYPRPAPQETDIYGRQISDIR